MCRETSDWFFFRYRCSSCHPCNNHWLGNTGQSVFCFQCCRRPTKRTDSRTVFKWNLPSVQFIHLFFDCTIQTGVSRMQTHDLFPRTLSFDHDLHYFFQCHLCTVINLTLFSAHLQQCRIHKWTCIDHNVRFFQFILPSYSNQIFCSRSRSDKCNHSFSSFIISNV